MYLTFVKYILNSILQLQMIIETWNDRLNVKLCISAYLCTLYIIIIHNYIII